MRTPVKPPTPTQCTSRNKNVDPIILHQPKSQWLIHIICFIRLSDKTQRTESFALSKNRKMPSELFDGDYSEDQNVKIGKRVIQLIFIPTSYKQWNAFFGSLGYEGSDHCRKKIQNPRWRVIYIFSASSLPSCRGRTNHYRKHFIV